MDIYLSIRCVIPAEMEEELPEILEPWPVLGTEIGESSEGGVRVTVYLSELDAVVDRSSARPANRRSRGTTTVGD
jgi:hypothetical protein